MTDLSNHRALVTGAASGLGLGIARALAGRGARVALVDVDSGAVGQAASSLGGGCIALTADISDRASIGRAVERAVAELGGLDTVVANAGIVGTGTVEAIDPQRWRRTIDVNVIGTFNTAQAAVGHLVASRGYLLLVASGFAASPGPYTSAYAASKAAVESLGRTLRIELDHRGVDVGVAYYSFLATPMVDALEGDPVAVRVRAAMPAPVRRTYSLDAAVTATVKGISRRADRVIYPGFLRWSLLLRGFLGPRSEGAWRRAMPDITAMERSSGPGT
jgi:NAD(P)-dependent dehydrogenase (short-subunit alcohol dehydrogenase family)